MSNTQTTKKNTATQEGYVEVTVSPAILMLILLAVVGLFFFMGRKSKTSENKPEDSLTKEIKGSDVSGPVFSAKIGESPVLGASDAPVTIFEFADFECPFCRAFYFGMPKRIDPAWDELKKNYIDTGKVKFVSKHFVAVPSHNPAAQIEARGAYCANKQGKYFEYAHELFKVAGNSGAGANQSYQDGGTAALEAELVKLAKKLGLNTDEFKACLASEESLSLYKADERFVQDVIMKEAAAAGEQGLGTPMFIICKSPKDNNTVCKGKVLMGAYPYRYFKSLIDDLLENKSN